MKEIRYSGGSYGTPMTLSSGSSFATGVAVDGSGNIFIADYGNNAVKVIPYSGGSYGTPVVVGSGFTSPWSVAVDGSGNVFIADSGNNAVKKLDFADALSLTFASTAVGSTSSDSPQTLTIWNIGNADLSFPIPSPSGNNPSISTGFTWNSSASGACPEISSSASSAGTLSAGSSCALSISFTPTTSGSISGSLTLKDNALNASYATQAIGLNGTGVGLPTVTAISPTFGPAAGGTTVTITGTGFSSANATGAVRFGATTATYTINSDTQITATSPANASGTVDITVTTSAGTSTTSAADQFTYLFAPTVSGISPTSGPAAGGTAVTITGTNFTGATGVSFGGTAGTNVTVVNATVMTATAPAGTGTVDVRVTSPGGTSAVSSADQYTYNQTIGSFTITGLSAGTAGTAQTITVTAKDSGGSTYTGYTGTVHFTSSDAQASIPGNYTFTASDNGVHTFFVTLKTAGSQGVTAYDVATSVSGMASTTISAAAAATYFLNAPGSVPFYTAFSFNAYARDAFGNTATSYNGTAVMTSSDPGYSNLGPFTFSNGATTVYSAFKLAGNQSLTLTDNANSSITGTATMYMAPGPVVALIVSAPSSTTAG